MFELHNTHTYTCAAVLNGSRSKYLGKNISNKFISGTKYLSLRYFNIYSKIY